MSTSVYDASLVTKYKVARTLYGFNKARSPLIPEQTKIVSVDTVLDRTIGASAVYRNGTVLFGSCACSENEAPPG